MGRKTEEDCVTYRPSGWARMRRAGRRDMTADRCCTLRQAKTALNPPDVENSAHENTYQDDVCHVCVCVTLYVCVFVFVFVFSFLCYLCYGLSAWNKLMMMMMMSDCQRRECMPGTPFWQYKVHADIRGGSLENRRQTTLGGQKGRFFGSFGVYIFDIFRINANVYYTVLFSRSMALGLHWLQNRWPWMILNGHFTFADE